MKVFQINTVLNGSTGKIARGIYDVAKQNGIEGKIAYSRGLEINGPDFIKIGATTGVYIHAAMSRIFDSTGLHSSFATIRLIREIKKFAPDVIHLHNLHGYYLNYKMLLKYISSKKIKTVYTLHDCWGFTGHCPHFELAGCYRWKTQCEKCPNKKQYPRALLFDRSRKNHLLKKRLLDNIENLTIVTPSNWLADLAKESFLGKHPIKVIHNGIDLRVFKPTDSDFRKIYNLENKKILLGVAGVWTHQKGLEDFFALREKLSGEYAIVLVGLTEKQKAELPEGIIGIIRTESAQELAGIYTVADVFVNPTYEDTFPTVNLEALACGTPVVTYRTGGSPECVDENCGRVVEKGDTDALKDAVVDFANRSSEIPFADFQFDQEHAFKKYVEIYIDIYSSGNY